MDQQPSGREDYVRKVLEAYRNTPGTCGNLRRSDRMLAIQLYQRGVPLRTVENALVLAAVRRLIVCVRATHGESYGCFAVQAAGVMSAMC